MIERKHRKRRWSPWSRRVIPLALLALGLGLSPVRFSRWLFLETDAFAADSKVDDPGLSDSEKVSCQKDDSNKDASVDPPPPPPRKPYQRNPGREPIEWKLPPTPTFP